MCKTVEWDGKRNQRCRLELVECKSTEAFKYAEGKYRLVQRWEFKIQRVCRVKRRARLTKVRWCMRNCYREWWIYHRNGGDEKGKRKTAMGKKDAEEVRGDGWQGGFDWWAVDRACRALEQNHSSTGHTPDTATLENPVCISATVYINDWERCVCLCVCTRVLSKTLLLPSDDADTQSGLQKQVWVTAVFLTVCACVCTCVWRLICIHVCFASTHAALEY